MAASWGRKLVLRQLCLLNAPPTTPWGGLCSCRNVQSTSKAIGLQGTKSRGKKAKSVCLDYLVNSSMLRSAKLSIMKVLGLDKSDKMTEIQKSKEDADLVWWDWWWANWCWHTQPYPGPLSDLDPSHLLFQAHHASHSHKGHYSHQFKISHYAERRVTDAF